MTSCWTTNFKIPQMGVNIRHVACGMKTRTRATLAVCPSRYLPKQCDSDELTSAGTPARCQACIMRLARVVTVCRVRSCSLSANYGRTTCLRINVHYAWPICNEFVIKDCDYFAISLLYATLFCKATSHLERGPSLTKANRRTKQMARRCTPGDTLRRPPSELRLGCPPRFRWRYSPC